MTSIFVIQNRKKSRQCLGRAWNLLQNGICKKEQHVVGNLDAGYDFIYVTLILLFFTVNHELQH